MTHSEEPTSKARKVRRPATSPEAWENRLIGQAMDLAERQIADGTASAQVISHFLKLGSSREKLEQEKIVKENELLSVRAEAFASAQRIEQVYKDALDAMRSYSSSASRVQEVDD